MEQATESTPGHRKLTIEEVNLMKEFRDCEAKFNGLIDSLRALPDVDQRHVSIAQTEGENAFMRAIRAIARPPRMSA